MPVIQKNSKYDELRALRDVQQKGVHVINDGKAKELDTTRAKEVLGIKTLGKIDFLMNYCGFRVTY